MRTGQHNSPHPDESGIPEFEPPRRPDDPPDAIEEVGKGIVNTFTVDRDTSLNDGAGAPGSTDVGGRSRDAKRS